jgi:predicted LPLAT superfamily acyltransferase
MNSEKQWDGKGTGSAAGNRVFVWLVRLFGVGPAYLLLIFVSLVYALRDRKTRHALVAFRRRAGLPTRFHHLYAHVFCFGMSLIDKMAFLLKADAPFSFEYVHEEYITDATAQGKGVILVGAHLGNGEVAGNLLVDRMQTPVNVVMLDAEREELKAAYGPATSRRRIAVIALSPNGLDTVVEATNCLRRGEILVLTGDRVAAGQDRERISFLGQPAALPRGPFVLAAVTGAPIIPVFAVKTGMLRYRFVGFDPIRVDAPQRNERDTVVRRAMETYVAILEKMAVDHPFQWFNFFDFWH